MHRGQRDPRGERLARLYGLRPTDFWRTPAWVVAAVSLELPLTTDASACADDRVCEQHLPPERDGLTCSWRPHGPRPWSAWWNPPYSPGLLPWMEKALEEHRAGVASVGLVPPSLGASYMELAASSATVITPIRGRIPFLHPDTGQPGASNRGDSCLIYFDGRSEGPAEWRYVDVAELRAQGEWALSLVAHVPHVFPGEVGTVARALCSSAFEPVALSSATRATVPRQGPQSGPEYPFRPILGYSIGH